MNSIRSRPTIKDVAARAGVSISSVSRALNGGPASETQRSHVVAVARELGFEPHVGAQTLRARSSKTIGCMAADLSNPHYFGMVSAAEDQFQRAGYMLMLASTHHDETSENAFLSAVRRRSMDGLVLFAGDNAHTTFLENLAATRTPTVTIDRYIPGAASVCVEHRHGGREATRHLLELGHRRIALLIGRAGILPTTERIAGYGEAFREAGLEVDPDLIRVGMSLRRERYLGTIEDVLRPERGVTAIITLGTSLLATVLQVLEDRSMTYPDDVSIVCSGDNDLCRHATPKITSLAWDLAFVGSTAADLLLDQIDRGPDAGIAHVRIPMELIPRGSCGEPPAGRLRRRTKRPGPSVSPCAEKAAEPVGPVAGRA